MIELYLDSIEMLLNNAKWDIESLKTSLIKFGLQTTILSL